MSSSLRPRSGTHLFVIEPGAVLFCEGSQTLYAFNGAAAIVWLGLEDGLDERQILDELAGAGTSPEDAPNWCRQSIEMFRLCGLLGGAYPVEPPAIGRRPFGELRRRSGPALPVARALHVNVFDSLLELRFSDLDLARIAEQIFARILAGDGRPADVSLDIGREGDRCIIAKGEMAIETDSPSALAGALEQAVTYLAIERTDFLLEFSAAVLERRGGGFLLPAPPGGGKTTLAVAMMQLGWNYGSDDIALMRRGEARLRCAPISLCLKQGSWSTLLPLMPQIESAPVFVRNKRPVRYLPPRGGIITGATIRHVVFPRHRRGAAPSLAPVARHDGLQRLFASCRSVKGRLTVSDVGWLVDWAGGIEFHALDLGEVADAMQLLEGRF